MPRQINNNNNNNNNNNTITVLNVAEKPSVARALAGVFSRMPGSQERPMQRGEAAQIFMHEQVCFPFVMAQGQGQHGNAPVQPHTMITTSVRGHLASQDFGPQYGWSSCPPRALFDAPIETFYKPDMQALEAMLKTLSRSAQALILWLDCDREGEAIGEEVREVCVGANGRLKVVRAKFSTVLPQEIQRALNTLGTLHQGLVQAVQARSQLDLRVGAAFTRFQTLRLQSKFDGFQGKGVISYGPCQFPTLGFVVERWARIATFIPEDFWFIEMTLRVPSEQVDNPALTANPSTAPATLSRPIQLTWKRARLYDRVLTMVLYEACCDAHEATAIQLEGRPKNKWRPVPLATVELQKRASRFLRIGSETLMTAAEELYQQGYISYPRTETERFRSEFEHMPLLREFATLPGEYGQYANKLLVDNHFQTPRAGSNDDNAHPPITPCKAVSPDTIGDPTQRSVYNLIVKHYLACCSRDAIGKETQLTVRMASEEFTAKGLMILERNWLEIYAPWERWSTGQGELPPVQVGSRIVPSSLLMKDGRTTAPQPLSEVELISLMDKNGIGTDATIAQHISTIQDREYAVKDEQQKFHPTKLGIALVEGYNSMGYQLNKPDLRREMEAECNLVAAGRKTKEDIIAPILVKMRECFDRANAEAHKLDEAVARHFPRLGASNETSAEIQVAFSECGVCHNLMTLKQAIAGGRANQNNRGDNRNPVRRKLLFCGTCQLGWGLPRGDVSPMTETDHGGPPVKCPICQFQVIRIARGDGYAGNGYQICPKCFSDPPIEHGGAPHGEFRCFQCQHPTCRLASGIQGGDIEVFPCPFCSPADRGSVILRKNSRGYVLSCNKNNRCQYTVWLPKAASTVSIPLDVNCTVCSSPSHQVRKVHFVWKPGSLPPHLGRECTACILCDINFRQDLEVTLPQVGQVGRRGTVRGNNRTVPANVARVASQRRNNASTAPVNGGNVCYRCGQAGHFASACPRNPS